MWGDRIKSNLLSGVASATLISVLGTGGTAHAQGVNWAGFYAGVYGGGAWSHSNSVTNASCPPLGWTGVFTGGYFCDLPTSPGTAINGAAVAAAGTGSFNSNNFVGGLQAGYNRQAGHIVYGVEADFGSFSVRGSRQGSGTYPAGTIFTGVLGHNFTVGTSLSTDWLFTARGRLGWAVDNWLLFATGGFALTNVETTVSFSDNNASGGVAGATAYGSNSSNRVGWTIGAGAEYALNNNWSLKAEYLYIDFGSLDASATVRHANFAGYTNLLNTTTDLKTQIARVGINYKF